MIERDRTLFTWLDIAGAVYRKLSDEVKDKDGKSYPIYKTPWSDKLTKGDISIRLYQLGERELFGTNTFEQRFIVAVTGGINNQDEIEEVVKKVHKTLHNRVINGVLIRKRIGSSNAQDYSTSETIEYKAEFYYVNWNF